MIDICTVLYVFFFMCMYFWRFFDNDGKQKQICSESEMPALDVIQDLYLGNMFLPKTEIYRYYQIKVNSTPKLTLTEDQNNLYGIP